MNTAKTTRASDPPPIGVADLQPGDVLLSLGDSNTSRAISALDGGQYSHAALWTGDEVVESTLPCVFEHSLEESLSKHPRVYVDVYRHRKVAGKQADVVKQAREFKGRPYAHGDLIMGALLLATTTWIPSREWQVKFLMNTCGFNFLNDKDLAPKKGELVTCTELAARAYLQAGVVIHIQPRPPAGVDHKAMVASAMELLRERLGQRRMLQQRDAPADVEQWEDIRAEFRRKFQEFEETLPKLPKPKVQRLGGPPVFEAGGNWYAHLVTPRHLQTSPDLDPIGRLVPASAAVPAAKKRALGKRALGASPRAVKATPRQPGRPARRRPAK